MTTAESTVEEQTPGVHTSLSEEHLPPRTRPKVPPLVLGSLNDGHAGQKDGLDRPIAMYFTPPPSATLEERSSLSHEGVPSPTCTDLPPALTILPPPMQHMLSFQPITPPESPNMLEDSDHPTLLPQEGGEQATGAAWQAEEEKIVLHLPVEEAPKVVNTILACAQDAPATPLPSTPASPQKSPNARFNKSPSRSIKRFWAELELEESHRSEEQRRMRVDQTSPWLQAIDAAHQEDGEAASLPGRPDYRSPSASPNSSRYRASPTGRWTTTSRRATSFSPPQTSTPKLSFSPPHSMPSSPSCGATLGLAQAKTTLPAHMGSASAGHQPIASRVVPKSPEDGPSLSHSFSSLKTTDDEPAEESKDVASKAPSHPKLYHEWVLQRQKLHADAPALDANVEYDDLYLRRPSRASSTTSTTSSVSSSPKLGPFVQQQNEELEEDRLASLSPEPNTSAPLLQSYWASQNENESDEEDAETPEFWSPTMEEEAPGFAMEEDLVGMIEEEEELSTSSSASSAVMMSPSQTVSESGSRRSLLDQRPMYTPLPSLIETVAFDADMIFPDEKPFDLVLSASFTPKRPRSKEYLPPLCRYDAGEDAFFVCRNQQAGWTIGVADGVGGWSELGIDPSLFAWSLMRHAESVSLGMNEVEPLSLLEQSYRRTVEGGEVKAGSSTAFIGVFDRDQALLKTTNLGDSGFLILRPALPFAADLPRERLQYEKVFRSVDTQHYFNAPYQLSIVPKDMERGTAKSLGDAPSDATQTTHELRHGDVLIFATDGLWDNLFEEDICALVTRSMQHLSVALAGIQPPAQVYRDDAHRSWRRQTDDRTRRLLQQGALRSTLRQLSTDIASQAKRASVLKFKPSPFSRGALGANRFHLGGKVDDITVLTACVLESDRLL